MTPHWLFLGVLVFGLAMVIWPPLFGRLISVASRLDPMTWGITPNERKVRDGFVCTAGIVIAGVALYLFAML
jgi:hypothetical protein